MRAIAAAIKTNGIVVNTINASFQLNKKSTIRDPIMIEASLMKALNTSLKNWLMTSISLVNLVTKRPTGCLER